MNRGKQGKLPPFSQWAKRFKPGIYKHYKGDLYVALFVARNSEDPSEELVIYQSLAKGLLWTRPIGMFFEKIEIQGKKRSRFAWVREI